MRGRHFTFIASAAEQESRAPPEAVRRVPRENHDIRLPPQQKARAPKKKKATKKAASAVARGPGPRRGRLGPRRGRRARRRTRGRPSSARGDQGPQARRRAPAAAPVAKIPRRKLKAKKAPVEVAARGRPEEAEEARRRPEEAEPRSAGRHGVPLLGARRV